MANPRACPSMIALMPVLVLISFLASPGHANDDRFSPSEPYLDQLLAMAARHDVPEKEVSSALLDGRLVPDREDLLKVLAELDPRPCDEILSEPDFKYVEPSKCEAVRFSTSTAKEAWNARFGLPPHDERYRYVRRMAVSTRSGFPYIFDDTTEEQVMRGKHKDKFLKVWDEYSESPAPFYLSMREWRDTHDQRRAGFLSRDRYLNQDGTTDVVRRAADEFDRALDRTFAMIEPDENLIFDAYERRRKRFGAAGNSITVKSVSKRGKCKPMDAPQTTVICEVRMTMSLNAGNALTNTILRSAEKIPPPYKWVVLERPATAPIWTIAEIYDECSFSGGRIQCTARQ